MRTGALGIAALCVLAQAHAGVIEVDIWPPGLGYQIHVHEPIGQSFTAEDPLFATVAFSISDANPTHALTPLTANLHEGIGAGGPLVASVDITPPPGITIHDPMLVFDFGAVPLDVGSLYTVLLHNENQRWGMAAYDLATLGSDPYTGGTFIYLGAPLAQVDARFRIVPGASTVAIPEPATLGLLVLASLGLRHRWCNRS